MHLISARTKAPKKREQTKRATNPRRVFTTLVGTMFPFILTGVTARGWRMWVNSFFNTL